MKLPYSPRRQTLFLLAFCLLVGLAAWPRLILRWQHDQINRKLWIVADGEELRHACKALGADPILELTALRAQGVNAVSLAPATLHDLELTGAFRVEPTKSGLRLILQDPSDPWEIASTLAALVTVEGHGGIIDLGDRDRLLWNSKLFFHRPSIDAFSRLGLQLVFRLPATAWGGRAHIDLLLARLRPGSMIVFDEKEALGWQAELPFVAERLKEIGVTVGVVEFAGQRGVTALIALGGLPSVNVHSIPGKEMAKYDLARVVARWARAVRERNVRCLYLRMFPSNNAPFGGTKLEAHRRYVGAVVDALIRDGYGPGRPVPYRGGSLALSPPQRLLSRISALLAASLLLAWLLDFLALLPLSALLALSTLALAAFAGAAPRLGSGGFERLLALFVGVVVPTLATLVYYVRVRARFEARGSERGRLPSVWIVLSEGLRFLFLILLGGGLITSLLDGPSYLARMAQFTGVKLVYLGPPALVAAYLVWERRWAIFEYRLRGRDVLLAGAAVVFVAVYILRSGNMTGQMLTARAEYGIRDRIEALLPARPRTKEFAVGYPALVLLAGSLAWKDRGAQVLFLMVGSVAAVSATNTFCHIHTPFRLNLLRGLMGFLWGLPLGLLLLPLYAFFRRRPHRYVALLGYTGFGNVGDEWILENLVTVLRPRLGDGERLLVFSRDPAATATLLGDEVDTARRNCPWALVNGLWNASAFVTGPGGIFQDRSGPMSAAYYLGAHVLAALLRVPRLAMVGQSFGSLRSTTYRKALALQARRCDSVITRDEASTRRLVDWGVPVERVVASTDCAFWLRPSVAGSPKRRARLGLALRPDPALDSPRLKRLAEEIMVVCREEKLKGLGLRFHPGQDEAVLCSKHFPEVDRHEDLTWPMALAEVAGCRVVLAMRYHAVIAALLTDTPFVALEYDEKVTDLLSPHGWPHRLAMTDLDREGAVIEVFRSLMRDRSDCMERMKRLRAACFEAGTRGRENFLASMETKGRPAS